VDGNAHGAGYRARDVVRAAGVRKRFGTLQAVDGIDLAVGPGERVGIIGPNGAGKTTLLLMLLGAIDPDEGTVELIGHRLPDGRSAAMEDVGFAAGYLPLPDRLRVHEALRFFADLHDHPDPVADVERVIEELDIQYLRDKPCMSLSSGQATLVGIAKAVMHRPRLVVLDEPTASLDPDVALRVRDALAQLSHEHRTALLLTSHDMREVEELTDRVVFLRDGRVLADGAPAAVVGASGHANLEELFLAEAVRMRGERL
jgi:ABC-2 type transport system ATP-binding protein